MPPRDETATVIHPPTDEDTATTTAQPDHPPKDHDDPAMNRSNDKYPYHNTPTHVGFFRNTFHYEINLVTFSLFGYLYYCLTRESHTIWYYVANSALACIIIDMIQYYYFKGNTPGVPYTLPLVNIIAMIIFPVRYWAELGTIAIEAGKGMCTSLMVNHYMIFITDHNLCRTIMTGEDDFRIYAHPNALWLFGSQNLIYMPTQEHKAFRAILTPALFSNEALQQYAQAEERVCHAFLQKYSNPRMNGSSIDARIAFRLLAAASSQEAFLGPYLTDTTRKQLEEDILTFTMGFLSFPIPYIGGLRKAILAKHRIEATIANMIEQARHYVLTSSSNPSSPNPPRCLIDRWWISVQETAKEQNISIDEVPYCDNDNMARTVLDFLFAAQDATNSALTFCLDVLDEHRDVLEKVRAEIDSVCGRPTSEESSSSSSISSSSHNIWSKMAHSGDTNALPYTTKVAIQLLHHKPPVPMIPHIAKRNTTLGGRMIPKHTIVIPSITYSARTSGASKEFLPDRTDDDPMFVSTVVFGAGQHKCPGRKYAESLLIVFLGVLVQNYDFTRVHRRPTMDQFVYYPTTFPNDCHFMITKRA
jgi:cytochrome P450 family 710 subfamily A protein